MNLSLSEAYTKLGLQDGASYDEVLNAKNMLMKEYEGNQEKRIEVEVAYDLIFNSRLKARLSGDLSVSNQVGVLEYTWKIFGVYVLDYMRI